MELPGIPAVYDFGTDPATGRIYLVMQLLYGQTLADLIAARDYAADPWPISWAAAIAAQVAATLIDVHRVDVVHRDIKPANLMVCTSGLVKILDFGVAILQGASALPKLTRIGMTVGSPPYMPPEQVLGNPVGPASDVVLTMLTKRPSARQDAEAVYDTLLPLTRSERSDPTDDRDPRRPFLRPFAPTTRARAAAPATARPTPAAPLSVDEAIDIQERIARLVRDSQLQQAIDILDTAVARAAHNPALQPEMRIQLATTLYAADEFTRAAATFDAVLPNLDGHEDAALLRYYADVSHAEIGNIDVAVGYLTRYLDDADPTDSLYRDAMYQLGVMLPAVGRASDGLRYLDQLRPILAAEYGPESIHIASLDKRIAQIRRQLVGSTGGSFGHWLRRGLPP